MLFINFIIPYGNNICQIACPKYKYLLHTNSDNIQQKPPNNTIHIGRISNRIKNFFNKIINISNSINGNKNNIGNKISNIGNVLIAIINII